MTTDGFYFRRLWADKWFILSIAAIISGLGLFYIFAIFHPAYQSTAKLWMRSPNNLPYITPLQSESADRPSTMAANPILTQLELMQSSSVAKAHWDFLTKLHPTYKNKPVDPSQYLKSHFKTSNTVSSETVDLTYTASDPKTAQMGLTQLIRTYLITRQQIETGGRHEQRQELESKLKDVERRLVQVRQKVRAYETNTLANNLDAESSELVVQRLSADTQLNQLNAQISSAQASVRELTSRIPNAQSAINAVALGAQHNPLHDLQTRLNEAKQQYAFDAIKLAPTNPVQVAQKHKIDAIQNQIDQQIHMTLGKHASSGNVVAYYDDTRAKLLNDLLSANVTLKGLLAQKAALEGARFQVHQEELGLPSKRYNLKNLQQEETGLALAYDELKKKQMESRLKEADMDTSQSVVLINPPNLPESEAFPSRNVLAALVLLLGLGIGTLMSFLKTRFSGFCSDPSIIQSITRKPVLATVPWFNRGYQQPVKTLAIESASDEAVANLLQACRTHGYQVLTLTSDCQGAHRPTLLMQMGRKLAEGGYRVALMDTNFRWPSLACRVDIPAEHSLSQLISRFQDPHISQQTAEALIEEFAYTEPDTALACFLNEQPLTTPGRYLSGEGFSRLLTAMRDRFDLILVNAPSLLNAPEAGLVASLTDAVLLVTSYGARQDDILEITEKLEKVTSPFLGTIVRAAV